MLFSLARRARRRAQLARRAGLLVLGSSVAWASPAAGQDKPGASVPPSPVLSPPVAHSHTDVPYPPGASGDAAVLLELTVAPDGSVGRALVIEGAEPFAAQALRGVLTWTFLPARRGATPVAARIRARVDFHQDAIAPPVPATPAQAPAERPSEPEEVDVRGVRREIGVTTLSAADVREMPGAFGDPFRAIEALPGVSPVVSGLPFFYIRGAPPNDNAYFVDGIRVPLLFHVGIGEGVIHPALVDHVDFYPGAAPAAYGGSAGAVIAGQTRDPATTRHGEIEVRLIDAGALLESPLGDGHGSALVAARHGYPGPVLDAITPTVRLGYWDYQARATWRVSERDTLGVFAFGSHDYLGTASTRNGVTGPIEEQLASDFHRVDLRYDRALRGGHLRIAATLGYDAQGGASEGDDDSSAITTVTNLSAALRLEADAKLSPAARLRGGADLRLDRYGFAAGQGPTGRDGASPPAFPASASADPPPTNVTGSAHADVVWRVAPGVELVPGVRVGAFVSTRDTGPSGAPATTAIPAIDPRLSARVTLAPGVTWLSALGLAHQDPALRVGAVPAMLLSVPGFPLGDAQLQTVAQASQGVEVALPADFTLTTTGFLSAWSGLTDLTTNCLQIMPPVMPSQSGNGPPPEAPYVCPSTQPVHGRAYGVEVLLRRPLSKRLSGWLSYTLSRSTRDEHFVTLAGGDVLATVPSDYDRTHVLNAILAYDLGRRWRVGGRFVLLSGAPYSNLSGNVPVRPYNGLRDPPFFRVDVRLEKRWSLGKDGYLAFIAEGQNVTLSREATPLAVDCMGGNATPDGPVTTQCSHGTVGPITIPSLGVEASF